MSFIEWGVPVGRYSQCISDRMMRDWTSPTYAFFEAIPVIEERDGRRCHVFRCSATTCKGRGREPRLVRRYLDTADRGSTGNLRKHAKECWGEEMIQKADATKDLKLARQEITKAREPKDGPITASFARIEGKGPVTYSHRQHTRTETRCVIVSFLLPRPLIRRFF